MNRINKQKVDKSAKNINQATPMEATSKMVTFRMYDKKEAEATIAEYSKNAVASTLIIGKENTPYILLKDHVFARDPDGGISWNIYAKSSGAHTFIVLTTGTNKKKTISLPICLLDDGSKIAAEILLKTTNDEHGRFNSKDAQFVIVDAEQKAINVKVSLAPLSLTYVFLKSLDNNHLRELTSDNCTLCQQNKQDKR